MDKIEYYDESCRFDWTPEAMALFEKLHQRMKKVKAKSIFIPSPKGESILDKWLYAGARGGGKTRAIHEQIFGPIEEKE